MMFSKKDNTRLPPCLSRRNFMLKGGTLITLASSPGLAYAVNAMKKNYNRQFIAVLSDLSPDTPIGFRYPDNRIASTNFLLKLNTQAGLGVGKNNDIVAFNSYCPHMGGPLMGVYDKHHKVAGPCPLHLTTFDLTRHGMVVSGHATQSLPQIVLEVDGNAIYATGVLGLIYGFNQNTPSPGKTIKAIEL